MIEDFYIILQSRARNVWLYNGQKRSTGFYTCYPDYIELYLVDPHRLGAGLEVFKLNKSMIPLMIRDISAVAKDGNSTLMSAQWYW